MAKVLKRYGLVFAILVMSSLIVYGDEEKSKATKAEPASKRILGNWEGKLSVDEKSLKKFMEDNRLPENAGPTVKKQIESAKFYFSFQEGGMGKSGMGTMGRISFHDTTWKIENDKDNQAMIVITDDKDEEGKLDATFQEDGTIDAKLILPEKQQVKLPNMTITLKKIKKLPEESKPMPPEEPETEKATPKPE